MGEKELIIDGIYRCKRTNKLLLDKNVSIKLVSDSEFREYSIDKGFALDGLSEIEEVTGVLDGSGVEYKLFKLRLMHDNSELINYILHVGDKRYEYIAKFSCYEKVFTMCHSSKVDSIDLEGLLDYLSGCIGSIGDLVVILRLINKYVNSHSVRVSVGGEEILEVTSDFRYKTTYVRCKREGLNKWSGVGDDISLTDLYSGSCYVVGCEFVYNIKDKVYSYIEYKGVNRYNIVDRLNYIDGYNLKVDGSSIKVLYNNEEDLYMGVLTRRFVYDGELYVATLMDSKFFDDFDCFREINTNNFINWYNEQIGLGYDLNLINIFLMFNGYKLIVDINYKGISWIYINTKV